MLPNRSVRSAFLVALALRVAFGLALPVEPAWDGVVYERAASQIAAGEGYTRRALSPSAEPTPTAFYPVGWPATLALWRATGMPRGLDPLLLAVLGALAVPLAAVLAGRLAGRRASALAAWLVALWPGGVMASATWMSEPLFTLLVLGAVVVALRPTHGALLTAAALLGLAAYVRPTALAIAPLVLAAAVWSPRVSPAIRIGRALGAGALALVVALVILSPWLWRNHAELGGAVLSTNSGANLLVGTASARFTHVPEAIDCDARGEVTLDRCRRDRAIARITSDPFPWLLRAPAKLLHTFGYESSGVLQLARALGVQRPLCHAGVWLGIALASAYWLALLALALIGLRRTRSRARWIALAPCVATALVHAASFGGDRYHVPLVPIVAALAAAALVAPLPSSILPFFQIPHRRRPAHRSGPAGHSAHRNDRRDIGKDGRISSPRASERGRRRAPRGWQT